MLFAEAYKMMKKGIGMKLPSWGGYWYQDVEKGTIIIHTKDGEELDIRQTEVPEYTFDNIASDEWQIADEKNCPELGGVNTFSFGEAIKYMKRGMKVSRMGWNGKKQYIQLATAISYTTPDGDIVNCEHEAIGNLEKTRALMEYKLEELTKRVDKHNNVVEITYSLEQKMVVQEEQIKVANHRIEDLERKGE